VTCFIIPITNQEFQSGVVFISGNDYI